jgi:hypothetical protein
MSENSEQAVATEPVPNSEVGNDALTQSDLASIFEEAQPVNEAEATEPVATEEGQEEPSGVEAEEVAESEDVLSQSESDDREEGPPPKSVQKLLKQVNRLTKRAKDAEEELEEIRSQPAEKAATPPPPTSEPLSNINTEQELEEYRKTARKAKRWAFENLGKGYVELDDEEYDDDRIRSVLAEADEALDELIPQRERFLANRRKANTESVEIFPWLTGGGDTEAKAKYEELKALPDLAAIHGLAKSELVFGLMVEGLIAAKARGVIPAKPATPQKPQPPKPVSSTMAVPPDTSDAQTKKRQQVLGDGNVDFKQFAQFLNTTGG